MAAEICDTEKRVALPPWRDLALFTLTLVLIVTCTLFTHVLLFSIVGAITLAIVTEPLAGFLRRRCSPAVAATLLLLLVTVAILLPLVLIFRDLLGELMDLIRFVQSGAAENTLRQMASNHPKVGGWIQQAAQQMDIPQTGKQLAGIAAGQLARALRGVASGVADAVMLLFFYFFLVRDRDRATEALQSLIPLRPADTHDLLLQTRDVIEAIFAGRVVIAIIQGVVAGIAYWLLGVPGALLWTAVTVVCCFVPSFGSFIAWVPIALYLGLAQSWTKAGILAAWGGIVVGNIDNVLYPVLVGKKTDLHTAVIFVAIFGGLALFGISGFVLGPVIVAVSIFLLKVWKRYVSAVDAAT